MNRTVLLGALAPTIALSLSGCALPFGDKDPPSSINQPNFARNGADVADVWVSRLNVERWADIAGDLGAKTQFDIKPEDLPGKALTTTSTSNSSYLNSLRATVEAAVAGVGVNKTATTAVDADGKQTSTSSDTKTLATPAAPPSTVTFNVQIPPTAALSGPVAGFQAHLQYEAAKSLGEAVVILNRQISSIASRRGYRPYFISLKLAVLPKARGYRYDTSVALKLISNYAGRTRDGYSDLPVIPLLANDEFEAVQDTETSERIRQLAASVRAASGAIAAGGDIDQTLRRLEQDYALRPNSLFSLAGGPGRLKVRLGANQFGRYHEMIPRTFNVSFVMLAPANIADELKRPASTSVRRTSAANADPSKEAPAPDDLRRISVEGIATFSDAAARSKADDTEPAAPALWTSVVGDDFDLKPYKRFSCPPPQTALIQNTGDGLSATVDLQGGEGAGYQNVEATLQAESVMIGGAPRTVTFVTRNVTYSGTQLEFYFPHYVAPFADAERKKPQVSHLVFRATTQDDETDQWTSCPSNDAQSDGANGKAYAAVGRQAAPRVPVATGTYDILYIPAKAAEKKADDKPAAQPATPAKFKLDIEMDGAPAKTLELKSASSDSTPAEKKPATGKGAKGAAQKASKPKPTSPPPTESVAAASSVTVVAPSGTAGTAGASAKGPPPPPPPPAPE